MTGEEAAGPAGPKLLRLLVFVGGGFICTAAINKWRQLEQKAILQKQQGNPLTDNSANTVQKAVE
ncbi:Transmembrane protein [Fagus crenata]|uniref:Uncharacterized protein n=1 Tax=Fagus sylvatica TaxID=28930 RepID=A0A2N9FB13_FAGSY